ncbi:MAG: hypothetical protein ACXWVU_01115, partial [Sulfuricurvum sp.]
RNKFENWLSNIAKKDNGANYKESTAKDYARRVFIEIPKYFNLHTELSHLIYSKNQSKRATL